MLNKFNADNLANKEGLMFLLHGSSAFQLLKAGLDLNLFEILNTSDNLSRIEFEKKIKLRTESFEVLSFGLVSLGLIEYEESTYSLSGHFKSLMNSSFWEVYKSMINFQSEIVYIGQKEFTASLIEGTNIGVSSINGIGNTLYEKFDDNLEVKIVFYDYMEKYSKYAIDILLEKIVFRSRETILDIGCGLGKNSIEIAKRYQDVKITLIDLTFLEKEVNEAISKVNSDLSFVALDFLKRDLPKYFDTILFIHQLVIWSLNEVEVMLRKAFDSLNQNGRVIIYSSMSNDNYNGPIMSALDSVYFKSVASGKGGIHRWIDYHEIINKIGFSKISNIDCANWTPHGIIIAHK